MHSPSEKYLDMVIVTDNHVATALPNLLTEWRMKKRWNTLSQTTRSAHRAILTSYLATGAPPETGRLSPVQLNDLDERDLIVMKDGAIASAYPFSTAPTRHTVLIEGTSIACVCAIDALGAGAMTGTASQVRSKCATCENEIVVETINDGLVVSTCVPPSACVWAGIVQVCGSAATTQCQSMLMFCSTAHLETWLNTQEPNLAGFKFEVTQAVQAGAAIFRPFLKDF